MRRYAILFALVSLLLPATAFAQGRTPEAALNHFKNALKKTGNGDFDGAIEDYTRAITLSSTFTLREEIRKLFCTRQRHFERGNNGCRSIHC